MTVRISNSATLLGSADRGSVAVTGSHGGVYSAYLAARAGVRAAVFNDAGRGLDDAGIAGLAYLERLGIAAAVVSHMSARIGDGADMMARGRISASNTIACELGCRPGMACAEAAAQLVHAPMCVTSALSCSEGRHLVSDGVIRIYALDSIALVTPADAGTIAVSGSHGGLIGAIRTAVKVDVVAAIYHDAGGGIEDAGRSRLPALDILGIAGATVAGQSARIGDGLSVWHTGVLSAINRMSVVRGARVGMTVQEYAACVRSSPGLPEVANTQQNLQEHGEYQDVR